MERETKRGPRMDEQLKKEAGSIPADGAVEGREEYHRTEGPTDEDLVDAEASRANPGAGLSQDEVELRSDIARFLQPSVFPATPDALLKSAEDSHAPDAITGLLKRLPDREFENVQAVWEALGGEVEERI
jgi:uncharacterized protein DUF2795